MPVTFVSARQNSLRSSEEFGEDLLCAPVCRGRSCDDGAPMDQLAKDVATTEGNTRLTAMAGAVLFVLLAVEGVTILRIHALVGLHIIVGMLLLPVALVKTATTTYRFARYYRGDRAYVAKGPPPFVLRIVGPFVVVLTVLVLLTGIAAAAQGPGTWWRGAHKAAFILWFGVTTVHVLGHIWETFRLALADFAGRLPVGAAGLRIGVIVLALVAGVGLAIATRHWADAWHHLRGG